MFNQKYMCYFSAVSKLTVSSEIRGFIVGAAVASAIASKLNIPAHAVVSPEAHFNSMLAVNARAQISDFNAIAVFDYDKACDLVRKFWLLRYNAVHNFLGNVFNNCSFAEGISSVRFVFADSDLECLNENGIMFGTIRQSVLDTMVKIEEYNAQFIPQSPEVVTSN